MMYWQFALAGTVLTVGTVALVRLIRTARARDESIVNSVILGVGIAFGIRWLELQRGDEVEWSAMAIKFVVSAVLITWASLNVQLGIAKLRDPEQRGIHPNGE
jgi:hypothetical protein